MWILLALGAALLASFNPILYKRILKDADPLTVVWSVMLLSLPLLGFFTVTLTPQLPQLDGWFALGVIGSAGLNSVAHLASTKALKLADVSLVTPLLIFSPVFTVLISAIFLGELPSARGLLGVGFILSGGYWLNSNSGVGWLTPLKSVALKPGVALVLFADLLWAITPLFEKVAIQHTNPESPRFVAFVAITLLVIFLTPLTLSRGWSALEKLAFHRKALFLASLIAGTAPVLGYTAIGLGMVGIVATLFKLSTMMTVVWSSLFLKEQGLRQRLPASGLMIIGAVIIVL
ncbi:MAG: DMT family transporter [Chloroflexi bacterium]|nr:DMT family transporter [Chloroflexota bacterium]